MATEVAANGAVKPTEEEPLGELKKTAERPEPVDLCKTGEKTKNEAIAEKEEPLAKEENGKESIEGNEGEEESEEGNDGNGDTSEGENVDQEDDQREVDGDQEYVDQEEGDGEEYVEGEDEDDGEEEGGNVEPPSKRRK